MPVYPYLHFALRFPHFLLLVLRIALLDYVWSVLQHAQWKYIKFWDFDAVLTVTLERNLGLFLSLTAGNAKATRDMIRPDMERW